LSFRSAAEESASAFALNPPLLTALSPGCSSHSPSASTAAQHRSA
jgi:hypothetical protein